MLYRLKTSSSFLILLLVFSIFTSGVAEANNAPTTVGTISDQSVTVGGSVATVDVSANFSDPDGDTLTYTATSSDTAKATVSVSSATVTITAVAAGTATITITATDPDGETAEQTLSVTVTQPNRAPVVASPIPNQRLQANGANISFNAFDYFSDPDGDTLHIVHTETDTNGNVEVVQARTSVAGVTTLTPKAAGTASVTIKVKDPSNATAQQTFNVRVNAAPTAVGTIHDRKLEVDGSTDSLDVSSYFTDESDDTLTYTATSNNTAIATVSMSGSTVTITPVGASVTLITVTATDIDGASVDQTFYARVSGTIPDQVLKVGGDSLTINTSPYFGRKGGDIFLYSVRSSNTAIVDYSPKSSPFGNWLANATIIPVAAGNATITVILTDTNGTTTKTFNVTVYSGPTAIGTMPDITFTSNGSSSDVDLSTYFGAFDMSDLTYTVVSSDTAKVTVSVSGTTLTVTSVAPGTATITARATDSDNVFATQTFTVTVKGPPIANGTIPDQTLEIGGSSVTINVAGYFIDPDGGTLTYDSTLYGAVSVTFDLEGSILTITPGQATGSGTLRIRATDPDGLSAKQEFTVTLQHANRAPVANGTIADITKKASDSAATVDLSGYFTDADADTLTYTAVSSDTTKVTVSLSDATLTVTPVAAGTATITTTATDPDGAFATQTFTMTVNPANRAPVASKTIPDQTIKRVYAPNSSSAVIALADYFSDPDGDALTYTAPTSDTNGVATLNFWTGPSKLSIWPLLADNTDQSGTGSITVTATDPDNASVSQTFSVTTSIPPHTVGTIADQYLLGEPNTLTDISTYFADNDEDTLTYSASSSNTSAVTVSLSGVAITFSKAAGGSGSSTISVTATDPSGFTATQTLTAYATLPPTTVGTIPDISGAVNQAGTTITLSSYFSDPNGQTLTYSATSSDTYVVSVSINSSNGLEVTPRAAGNATITVTATNTDNLSATQSISVTLTASVFVGEADPVPGISSDELSQLGALVTYDTLIFNELYNGSDDANDWLELRNVSAADLALADWQLSILMGAGNVVVDFPADTVIPAGGVLLLTNTAFVGTAEASVSSIAVETFTLPQEEFALILQGPSGIGDLAVNYFQTETESASETAPVLTVDTVWHRNQPIVSGYLAAAWSRNIEGTPGYRHATEMADLNNDGVVNILDLVLVASQFGMDATPTADLNADGVVNIQDLVLVANAVNGVAAAPSAQQSQASVVNNWLQLARQTSLPDEFSYTRGIQVLEQLAQAFVPEATALLANYPNPFNPETWIPYQLAKGSDVTVSIYTADGSVVRTLVLGHQDAGEYKTRTQAAYWDGRNAVGETVASGVYFYTLTAGEFTATRKMLILK